MTKNSIRKTSSSTVIIKYLRRLVNYSVELNVINSNIKRLELEKEQNPRWSKQIDKELESLYSDLFKCKDKFIKEYNKSIGLSAIEFELNNIIDYVTLIRDNLNNSFDICSK